MAGGRPRTTRVGPTLVAVGALASGALGLARAFPALANPAGADRGVAVSAAPDVLTASAASRAVTPDSVLVVGDSIVSQADSQTRSSAPPGSSVWVAGGLGSAPCDWTAGYRDPYTGAWHQLSRMIDQYRPAAVVLSFSGNAGLSGPRAGCVDSRTRYSLAALLASYQSSLSAMARYATARGALVYLDASPPRNPQTPPGPYRGPGGSWLYGFNGVSQLHQLYAGLAGSAEGRRDGWHYDPAPAAAVSDSSLRWHLTEQCAAWDLSAGNCGSGLQVQVRAGGYDSIHLDPRGSGGTRYGMALVRQPLSDEGYPG